MTYVWELRLEFRHQQSARQQGTAAAARIVDGLFGLDSTDEWVTGFLTALVDGVNPLLDLPSPKMVGESGSAINLATVDGDRINLRASPYGSAEATMMTVSADGGRAFARLAADDVDRLRAALTLIVASRIRPATPAEVAGYRAEGRGEDQREQERETTR